MPTAKKIIWGVILFFLTTPAYTQVLTSEDSLSAGLIANDKATVISGYGEARYSYDVQRVTAEANLKRVVLFVGHKFNSKISLFTELELENAFVLGGGSDEGAMASGSISMEQAFIKFDLNPATYIVGGLFIPRIGLINENHLPTTFNGVDRPYVEQLVIPSTWRGVGAGLYGSMRNIPGLNYNLSLTNGLNSENFVNGSGIRNGRQLGASSGFNLALTGSLLYYIHDFRIQVSGYMGGSTGAEKRIADSLYLNSGAFANTVSIGEANVQYQKNAWSIKALAATVNINNASDINRAYASNAPENMFGAYAELAYNLLYKKYKHEKALFIFVRYEQMHLSNRVPLNGVQNDANKQQYIIAGFTYKPVKGISVKAEYARRSTGEPNPALIITPFPQQLPYYRDNDFINLGIAYNF